MGLDVCGSVAARAYRLQLDGLAAALRHRDVAAALRTTPPAPARHARQAPTGGRSPSIAR